MVLTIAVAQVMTRYLGAHRIHITGQILDIAILTLIQLVLCAQLVITCVTLMEK